MKSIAHLLSKASSVYFVQAIFGCEITGLKQLRNISITGLYVMVFANIVAWLDVTPDWLFLYLKRENSEWCEDPNLNLTKVHVTELSTANGQNWFRSSNPTNKLNQFHVILRILHYFLYLLSLSWEMFRCIVGVKNLPKKSLRRYHGNFLKIVVTCWKNSWPASLPPD